MKSILPGIDDFVKKAESIHESAKEWENIFHSIPDMITIHDKDFNILFANNAAKKLLDLPQSYDMRKIKCFKYYHGTACPPQGCPSCECLKTGKSAIFELFEPHLNMIVEIRAIPRLDKRNNVIGIIHIARDITQRKNMEEKLRNSRKQLRSCVSNMISIRENERAKISREIHDELSQSLTTMKMNLFLLGEKTPKNQITSHQIISSMSTVIDSTLKEIKRIASDLRPKILDELGILEAVKWQARKFQEETGIACDIDHKSATGKLNQNLSLTIFRIYQETLTNVARHAKATRVQSIIKRKRGAIYMEIKDNGVGITDSQVDSAASHGIIGLRERVQLHKGQIEIKGIQNQGTSVTITLPLNNTKNDCNNACKGNNRLKEVSKKRKILKITSM